MEKYLNLKTEEVVEAIQYTGGNEDVDKVDFEVDLKLD
jgi:hypothetical protein